MTAEERTRIQEAACRYVREQAPTPPIAVLERVARIVLHEGPPVAMSDGTAGRSGGLDAA